MGHKSVTNEPHTIAEALYHLHIAGTGFTPPTTYAELLLFIALSGCPVGCCVNAPDDFSGVQLGGWAFVTGSDHISDYQRMRIAAHEWCHWLREERYYHRRLHLYGGTGEGCRAVEEEIARAFERLF